MNRVTLSAKLPQTWRRTLAKASPGVVVAVGLMLFGTPSDIHGVELVVISAFAGAIFQFLATMALLVALHVVARLAGEPPLEMPPSGSPYITSTVLLAAVLLVYCWGTQRHREQMIRACVVRAVDEDHIAFEPKHPGYTANRAVATIARDCVSRPDEEIEYDPG